MSNQLKIFISGSNGFIGRNLTEYFRDKYHVICPGSKELNLLDSEQVEFFLQKEKPDIIIHAANQNTTRNKTATPYDSLNNNLRMYYNLKRCSNLFGKMYYFGSGAEYDMRFYIPEMSENYFGKHIPEDPYGFSKYIMAQDCLQSRNIYDLVLFGVYGKYEEWERRFISNNICKNLAGESMSLNKNVNFDYLYIDDLCKIMDWFIEHVPEHKRYNVCSGGKVDLLSLAKIINQVMGKETPILINQEGWKTEYTGSNRRLLEEIGEFIFTSYEEGIKNLFNYYQTVRTV
ncbi:NAD-dependent epimerase/dehydratase family protein [Eisenbergiella tayi]|uniref:NAD-dependent epimerase/dehydratase family protein n=1 Tax=Eisenbergiella tayi TaxID=1432052 RepID=UPI001FA7BC65|nr:NAD(P)-dependent oxidoreductase [Eisenbergiella tayi]